MRHIDCILCDSKSKRVIVEQKFADEYLDLIDPAYQDESRRWVTCESCGFVYHDPQLDEVDTSKLYEKFRDMSFRNETPDEYFDRITTLPKAESENSAKVDWLHRELPDLIRKGGRILDIGCGGGVFLHTFLKTFANWEASGIEPTIAFAELASRRLDRPILAGSYSKGMCGTGFDLITCNQVLEHTTDPKVFLDDIYGDLKEGGCLYLETPDTADFALLPPDHDRFLMQHLWYFASDSLQRLARKAGFEVVTVQKQLTKRGRNNLIAVFERHSA